jgi:hypothetical protein
MRYGTSQRHEEMKRDCQSTAVSELWSRRMTQRAAAAFNPHACDPHIPVVQTHLCVPDPEHAHAPLSVPAGSPASAADRHVVRLSHNPATETLHTDITERLAG